jgi:hypothetical protein
MSQAREAKFSFCVYPAPNIAQAGIHKMPACFIAASIDRDAGR